MIAGTGVRRPSLVNVYLVTGTATIIATTVGLLGDDASPMMALFGSFAPLVAVVAWFHQFLRGRRIASPYDWGYLYWIWWWAVIPLYVVRLEGRRGWRLVVLLAALILAPQSVEWIFLRLRRG